MGPMENVLVALLGAGGAATVWAVFKGVTLLLGAAGKFRNEDRRSLAEVWQQLFNVQAEEHAGKMADVQAAMDKQGKLIEETRSEIRKCELERERDEAWRRRANEWIEAAQEGMTEAKVKFRPWNPNPESTGGSPTHNRLTTQNGGR